MQIFYFDRSFFPCQKKAKQRAVYGLFIFLSAVLAGTSSCDQKTKNLKQTSSNSVFYRRLSAQPETLHPIRASDAFASLVQGYILDRLLIRNVDSNELEPSLAEKWEISSDYKIYTFYLRKGVLWHDGKPLTAEDVRFSLSAYQDVSYGGAHYLSYFENIERAEVIDSHTIRFYAKKKHFGSFEKFSLLLNIIPKHIYQNKKTKLNRSLLGSGPYTLAEYDQNKKIVLKKNKNWWGSEIKKGEYRFDQVVFRIIPSDNDALLRMEQGRLDFMGLNSESYFKKTLKAPWGDKILKKKVRNLSPKSYSFTAWNLKNPLFKDRRVRKALSHLMNRELMNEKFYNNSYALTSGPIHTQSKHADPHVKPILFSMETASKLLKEAGWADSNKNGILDKKINNQVVEFQWTLLFPSKSLEKYLTLYQEDLKKAGLKMSLKLLEWVSFTKALDERNFDAVTLAWSPGASDADWHPRQIWHSDSIANKGSNFISYSNLTVDQLIDSAGLEMNPARRNMMLKKLYRIIAEDVPYTFMFNPRYHFYAHSRRVKMVKPTYRYSIGYKFWWFE